MEPLAVTVEQAASALSISTRHAYSLVRSGELPALRLGSRWIVPKAALERLLSEASGDAPPQVPVKA